MHPVVSNERDSSDAINIEVHRAWPNSGSKTRTFEAGNAPAWQDCFPSRCTAPWLGTKHWNIVEKMG